jgi:DNA-binding transcriptional ArsR family regulator
MADQDAVFKALGDASRRDLLDRLHLRNGQTLNQLCENVAMTRQAVTKHIGILEAANLVVTVKKGREKFHYLNPVPISEIYLRWVSKFETDRMQALSILNHTLKEHKNENT